MVVAVDPETLATDVLKRFDVNRFDSSKQYIVSAILQETVDASHAAGLDIRKTIPIIIDRILNA